MIININSSVYLLSSCLHFLFVCVYLCSPTFLAVYLHYQVQSTCHLHAIHLKNIISLFKKPGEAKNKKIKKNPVFPDTKAKPVL